MRALLFQQFPRVFKTQGGVAPTGAVLPWAILGYPMLGFVHFFQRKLLLLFCLLFFTLPLQAALSDKAYTSYLDGERATSAEVRKKAFNDALTEYLRLETDNSSGKLFYDIGNCYFQLGEYGFSALYYYKGLKLEPRDAKLQMNLRIALEKAGVKEPPPSALEDYVLFFHYRLSHNEKMVIGLLLFCFVFVLFSLHLWIKHPLAKKGAVIFLWISFALTVSIVWSEYLAPKYAVVVKPSVLRLGAGKEYAAIQAEPLIPGMRVEVVSVAKEGDWLKVSLPSGPQGYVSNEYVRLV